MLYSSITSRDPIALIRYYLKKFTSELMIKSNNKTQLNVFPSHEALPILKK